MILNEKELSNGKNKFNSIVSSDTNELVDKLTKLIFNEEKKLTVAQKEKINISIKENLFLTTAFQTYIKNIEIMLNVIMNLEKNIILKKQLELTDVYSIMNYHYILKTLTNSDFDCKQDVYRLFELIQDETDLNLPLSIVFELETIINKNLQKSMNKLTDFNQSYLFSFENFTQLNQNIYFNDINSTEVLETLSKDMYVDLEFDFATPIYEIYNSVPITSKNYYNHFIKVVFQIYMNYFKLKKEMEFESSRFKKLGTHVVNIYTSFRNELTDIEKTECLHLIKNLKKSYDESIKDEIIREELITENLNILFSYKSADRNEFFENNNLYKTLVSIPTEIITSNKTLLNNILEDYIIFLDNKLRNSNNLEEVNLIHNEIIDFVNTFEYNEYYSRYYFYKLCRLINDNEKLLYSIKIEIPEDIKFQLGINTNNEEKNR